MWRHAIDSNNMNKMILTRRSCMASLTSAALAKTPTTRLIAHRGAHGESEPENSAAAMQRAIHRSYWMVEVDLRRTADGKWVVVHDQNLKRLCGVDREVRSSSWKELQAMKLGATSERILLWEELLELLNGRIGVWLDVKDVAVPPEGWNELWNPLRKHRPLIAGIHAQGTTFFADKMLTARSIQDLFHLKRAKHDISRKCVLCEGLGFALSSESIAWAQRNGVEAVPFVGNWHYPEGVAFEQGAPLIRRFQRERVEIFMIDPIFESLFGKAKE